MKKILLIAFISVLLLIPTAIAGEIFDGEVKDNEYFTVEGVKHIARYYGGSVKKLSLKVHAGTELEKTSLIELKDCKAIYTWTYCFDGVDDLTDDETGDAVSVSNIRIVESGPSLDIDRSFSSVDPAINEDVEVDVIITNNGNERASNFLYKDKYPAEVKISSAALDSINNQISWSNSLNPGETASFSYKLKFEDFIEHTSQAEVTYYFNNKVNKDLSDEETFTVRKPYSITHSFSTLAPAEGEEVTYIINISNNDSSTTLDITDLKINLPSHFAVTKKDLGFERKVNAYEYNGQVSAGNTVTLELKFKSVTKGIHDVSTDVDCSLGNLRFEETNSEDIRVGISNIVPEITITPESTKSGKEIEIEAKITNEGTYTIDMIRLDLISDILEVRGWRTIELDDGETYYAYNKILNAPSVDEETEYYITLSGSYQNDAGKTFEYEETKTFTVQPGEKLVELTPKTEVIGQEVKITINVKNVASHVVKEISLIDSLPTGFSMVSGDRFADIESLAIGEDIDAYNYTVKIPDDYRLDNFVITHMFNGDDSDGDLVTLETTSLIDISEVAAQNRESDNEEPSVDTEEEETLEETEDVMVEDEEKKPGVFKRMWNWIKGLFSGDDVESEDDSEESVEQVEVELEE